MKLKAVLKFGCDPAMQAATESKDFYNKVLSQVLVPHLHMKGDLGPAEFYIQQADLAVGREENLCEVRLSVVSTNRSRATNDFFDARRALEELYRETLQPFVEANDRLQLMVSLILDQPPFDLKTTLIERQGSPAIWVAGARCSSI